MNIEQRISNLERNAPAPVPGNLTLGRIELINTASAQSLTNSTDIVIGASGTAGNQWSIVENSGGLFTLGTSTGLVTVKSTGRYCIYGKIRMDSSALGARIFSLLQNSSVAVNQNSTTAVGNGNATMAISVPSFRLTANDTLELRIFQNSGAARTFAVASTNPLYFIVEYLGA
jgi:hypothetical protein